MTLSLQPGDGSESRQLANNASCLGALGVRRPGLWDAWFLCRGLVSLCGFPMTAGQGAGRSGLVMPIAMALCFQHVQDYPEVMQRSHL